MKKALTVGFAVLIGLTLAIGVYAMGPDGWHGMGFTTVANLNIDAVKNFLKDTSSMRNELILKRIELAKAYSEKELNYDKIAAIQKEIIDLRTRILDSAKKYGLDKDINAWFGMGAGRMQGMRGMGQGMMGCPQYNSPKP